MNHIVLNHQILVNKVGPVTAVRHNPSDMGGRQEHILRLLGCKEIMNCLLVGQIQFRMRTQDKVRVTFCLQVLQDGGTDQSPDGLLQIFYYPYSFSSFIKFSRYCPYWFFSIGVATRLNRSASIQPFR